MTDYAGDYNEYLDQTVGLPEEPIGASIGVSSVGQQLMGSSGSQQLQTTGTGGTAGDAGKVPLLNAAGVFDQSLLDYGFSGTAGAAIAENDLVYIDASNLIQKFAGILSGRVIGIAGNTVSAGQTVYIKTGPVVGGLSGLLPGYVYYSGSAGDIVTGTATSIGGKGGTFYNPLGIAISTTELLLYYGGSAAWNSGSLTLTIPAVGTSADTNLQTANIGAAPAFGWGTLYMEASDAASGNTTKRIYHWIWGNTDFPYTEVNGAGTASLGITSTVAVVPNAGVNRSTITVKLNQGAIQLSNYGGIVIRVTNAIAAGTGSTVGSLKLIYNFIS